jgi:hypothetical protein
VRAGEATQAEVVGNRIAFNRIHDGSNAGVRYAGNDNVIECNEVYRIGLDSSDLGAFYTNSGWTSRGNVLRHNLVHHCENAQGFYLDDGDCGDTVEGNLIYKVQSGLFIGGGSDHVLRDNIIVASERGIHIDARGKARNYTAKDPRLAADLASVPYARPPWSERYPDLAEILTRDTTLPTNVRLDRNLVVACPVDVRRSASPAELKGVQFGQVAQAPLSVFKDPEALNFTPSQPEELQRLLPGLHTFPVAGIGLQTDEFRRSIPARNLKQLQSESTARRRFDSQTDVDATNRIQAPKPGN